MGMSDERLKKLEEMMQKMDSISLTKGMGGRNSWQIHIYCDNLLDEVERNKLIDELATIHDKMKRVFPDEPVKK